MVAMNFLTLALLPALAWAVTTVVDDTDPQIKFDSSWSTINDHVLDGGISTNYYGGTTHASTTPGGSFSFVFTGTGITYYGDVDVDNADFTVQIDQTSGVYHAKASGFNSNQILYTVSGLPNTQHTFTVKHSGASGEWATIDRLAYESDTAPTVVSNVATVTVKGSVTVTGNVGTQALPNSAISSKPTPTQTTGLPTGAVIGIAVGGAVLLIILAAFLIVYMKRKRRLQQNTQATHDIDFLDSGYPQQQAPASHWATPFNLAAATTGGNYAPVPQSGGNYSPGPQTGGLYATPPQSGGGNYAPAVHKPQNLAPVPPVVPSLLPPSYDEVESQAPPSEVARSSTYDPYNDSEYTPSSSAYAPSSAGFVVRNPSTSAPATSSNAQRTYPVDRKVRPT